MHLTKVANVMKSSQLLITWQKPQASCHGFRVFCTPRWLLICSSPVTALSRLLLLLNFITSFRKYLLSPLNSLQTLPDGEIKTARVNHGLRFLKP